MAKYPLRNSPNYKPPRPVVQSYRDTREYISLGTVNKPKLDQILAWMKANRMQWYRTIHEDPFIKIMIEQFDADILLPRKQQ